MAARKIDVDDEVFAYLQREAIPFVDTTPNDVLRRKLLGESTKPTPPGATGQLMSLIAAGHLKPGDRLVHHQPRKRRTFTAVVTEDGFIQTDDERKFADPSPALKSYVGHEVSGWRFWIVERTGRPLKDYRYE